MSNSNNTSNKRPIILVVEDEPKAQEIIKEMTHDQYTLLQAYTGKEAIQLFENHYQSINLILLDINLPDMNGFEVYQTFESIVFMGMPNIIMVTAYNDAQTIIKSMTDGHAFYHISKPFTQNLLLDTIKTALAEPFFARKEDEMNKDMFIDQIIGDRNYKLVQELISIQSKKNMFPTQQELSELMPHNSQHARKNINYPKTLQLFEEDIGETAPKSWLPKLHIMAPEHIIDNYKKQLCDSRFIISHSSSQNEAVAHLNTPHNQDIVLLHIEKETQIAEVTESIAKLCQNSNTDTDHPIQGPDIILIAPTTNKKEITESLQKGAYQFLDIEAAETKLLPTLNQTFIRRFCLCAFPLFLAALKNQTLSFRIRLQLLEEELSDIQLGSSVDISKIYMHFPEFMNDTHPLGSQITIQSAKTLRETLTSLKQISGHRHMPKTLTAPSFNQPIQIDVEKTSNSVVIKDELIVLMIEDQEDNISIYKALFESENIKFHFALTGQEGAALWESLEQKPTLIVIDYYLNDMTGDQLIHYFRQRGDTPIIIFTAAAHNERKNVQSKIETHDNVYVADKLDYPGKKLIELAQTIIIERTK